jgi:hydroxymethylbilane synthase
MKLRIGSRGSQLALWQANHIAAHLRAENHTVEITIIRTTGDRMQDAPFAAVGSKGMFTREIEEALEEGRVDLAVHSLKDLPTDLPPAFVLAAIPARADVRDVLVSAQYHSLAALPLGARVGTSSQRRRAQLKSLRPDLVQVEFRGNVDTRLRKIAEGQVEAILLAAAGLDRLEKTEWIRERFEPAAFCPAAGQGALAIETRRDDHETIAALRFLDDPETRFAVTTERACLGALGGGCQVPIGVHCRLRALEPSLPAAFPEAEIFAVAAAPESGETIRIHHRAPRRGSDPVGLGEAAARALLGAGAASVLGFSPAPLGGDRT